MYSDLLYASVGDVGNVEEVLEFVFGENEVGEVLVGIGRTRRDKRTNGQRREGSC